MNFVSYEELRAYVRDTKHPSFKEFVDENSLNISRWSSNNDLEASDLFSMWRRRYALFLKEFQKIDCIISSKKYDENKWQLIAKMAKTLSEASFVTRIEMLEAMIAAAPSSSIILKELLSSQKDEYKQQQKQGEIVVQQHEEKGLKRQAQQQQSAEDHQFEDLDKEGHIYLLGHKKFSGKELTVDEKNYLQSITNEGTIKSCIQFLAVQRLLLEELDVIDAIIVKLGISRIVNAINPTIRNLIYSNLNDNEKQVFVMKCVGTPLTGLEPDVCTVIDNIIKVDEFGKHKLYSMEDMDELLEQIQTKKTEYSKNKQRDSQLYQALSCMEMIIESFDLWDDDDKTSEIIHYRRFASLLDIIFKKNWH